MGPCGKVSTCTPGVSVFRGSKCKNDLGFYVNFFFLPKPLTCLFQDSPICEQSSLKIEISCSISELFLYSQLILAAILSVLYTGMKVFRF